MSKEASLRVVSPVPWFPFVMDSKARPNHEGEQWGGLFVYRPRFFYFPGVLKNLDSRFYARGVRPWVRRLCKEWAPDVLDAHFVWPDGVAVGILARELGIPYTITLRGKLYECLPVSSQRKQCAEALKGASAVISVSSRLKEEAVKLGVPPDRVSVIPNGVDFDRFYPRDKLSCRKELGLPEEGRLLVTVAHLGHRKGHHEVIRALAGLPEDVRLVIVGGPAQGGTAERLYQVASEAGVADRLILPGAQPYDRIPVYFCAADASVLASYREGCPNAVLESLACGTPVVATDVGAVRDILKAPDVGRIVPEPAIEPIRRALEEVLGRSWVPEMVLRASAVRSWGQVAGESMEVLVERSTGAVRRPLSYALG